MTHDEWLLIRKLYVDAMTLQTLVNRLVSDLKPLADHDPRATDTRASSVRGGRALDVNDPLDYVFIAPDKHL
jgi:hypothetical protein